MHGARTAAPLEQFEDVTIVKPLYVPGGTSAPELTCAGFGTSLPVPSIL